MADLTTHIVLVRIIYEDHQVNRVPPRLLPCRPGAGAFSTRTGTTKFDLFVER